jgi:myosin heavy subunit
LVGWVQVAKASYDQMRLTGDSQSIVIGGESGAGKTECTKLVLAYLTSVSGTVGVRIIIMIIIIVITHMLITGTTE